jgi:general secretion pathway protein F
MPASRPLSLDQFIALNEEMAALVRAGIPLDQGLAELGRDAHGRLGAMAASLGERLERGETLEQILSDDANQFPPLSRAVAAREMRRSVGLALVYPLFVVMMAVVLFAVVAKYSAPAVADAYRAWRVGGYEYLDTVAWLGERAWQWAPWIPLLILLLGAVWWWRSGRAAQVQVSGRRSRLKLPTLAALSKAGRMASFSDVLRLLIEHRVPLPEALVLAGEASGDRRLEQHARGMAERLERGERAATAHAGHVGFPPLLAWLLTGGAREAQLVSALEHVAQAYRHDALRMVYWLSVYLPLVLTAAIGGAVVLAYALTVLGPVFHLLNVLGQP